jgi:Transglycosylase SLT domain/Peptidase family M23
MRNKYALTAALAGFALATALGVGLAGAESPASTESAASLPSAPTLPALSTNPAPLPACSDGVDNDGDGLVDMEDPNCSSPTDNSEEPEPAAPSTETGPAPEESETEAPGSGFKVGSSIGGGNGGGGHKVVHHEDIGAKPAGGTGGSTGAITAPPATAGVQPPETTGISGGSAFNSGGSPTAANPTVTIAPFGPAPIGVPNFLIESFEIPPFLLPIYQACGTEYGIPWEVLAAINKIETDFGTNLNVSSAGAVGWMQFLPSSWETYGLDANGDGRKDPYNPVDAICAAAHYLKVAGGTKDLYNAILSYNHADWYVQEVLLYARAYGKLPTDLVSSLTGLTEGAHFPVAANARYADEISARVAMKDSTPGARKSYGNAADVISSSPTRRGINIFAAANSPVVAVNDGVILKSGHSAKLGKYVVLEDAYGNRFTYAELGSIVHKGRKVVLPSGHEKRMPVDSENIRPRLFALPGRAEAEGSDSRETSGPEEEVMSSKPAPQEEAREEVDEAAAKGADGTLKVGSKVIAGTVIGRIGPSVGGVDPHINFSIRPAGKGAPRIDPKPILDGWKLLEETAIYRANGKNALASDLGGAGVLLLSKEELQKRVLDDPKLNIYQCGRNDIATGQIDRRVLALLEYLVSKGFSLRISSLKCGHSILTTNGSVSEHATGDAVDIAEIDGVIVSAAHQGPGTLVDQLIKDVLALQGPMHPHQVISLENLPGETSFAEADHYDDVHIGYYPTPGSVGNQFESLLKPDQWTRLTNQLNQIENPEVPTGPSRFSLPDKGGKTEPPAPTGGGGKSGKANKGGGTGTVESGD